MPEFFRPPAHLSDVAPPAAARLERARRAALDWLIAHDYELHIPPLADYAESLGADDESLRRDIFKMTDTLSGRTLGIRADHTPQIARFDAAVAGSGPRRLCYCGPALLASPPQPWKEREIMQIGAEIFGAPSPDADWEIIRLAVGALQAAGVEGMSIDIGHPGLVRQIAGGADAARDAALCRRMARRDVARLQKDAPSLAALLQAGGDISEAGRIASAAGVDAAAMLEDLSEIAERLRAEGFDVAVDFGEIGGYGYHTGAGFSIAADGFIAARGGRYARGREASGFSMDLREIASHLPPPAAAEAAVSCPASSDPAWFDAVQQLREQGRRLRFAPAGSAPPAPALEHSARGWRVRES